MLLLKEKLVPMTLPLAKSNQHGAVSSNALFSSVLTSLMRKRKKTNSSKTKSHTTLTKRVSVVAWEEVQAQLAAWKIPT